MNWFIEHAPKVDARTKSARAVYVVCVESTGEPSKDMLDMLNSRSIREKLESAYFITIHLKPESTPHKEFTTMYHYVPVPGIVFVDPNGGNMTKTHCTVSSAEEFERQLDETLDAIFRPVTPLSRSFLGKIYMGPTTSTTSTKAALALLERHESEDEAEKLHLQAQGEAEKRIERPKHLLQQAPREIIQHPESKDMESLKPEDRRVGAGQDSRERQKERELRACKEKMRRERAQDAGDHERIRKQIAGLNSPGSPTVNVTADELSSTDLVCLHFHLPNGKIYAHTFGREAQFSVVRAYVTEKLLPGTGIKAFTMVAFYQNRPFSAEDEEKTLDELDLFPNTTIAVVKTKRISNFNGANGPQAIHLIINLIINVFCYLLWVLLSPIVSLLRYLKTLRDRHAAYRGPRVVIGTHQPESSKHTSAKTDDKPLSKGQRGSTVQHADNRPDSGDEKSNWNGNSIQQQ